MNAPIDRSLHDRPRRGDGSVTARDRAKGSARIGPNALTQTRAVAIAWLGVDDARWLFSRAGLEDAFDHPPTQMVPEWQVAALVSEIFASFPQEMALAILDESGALTADYLLEYRIPALAQRVLKRLPVPLAARFLARAIAKHAWTFAGSGVFSYAFDGGLTFRIENNPMCRGLRMNACLCSFHARVFTVLFQRLVHPDAVAVETDCCGQGDHRDDGACIFAVSWK